MLDALEIGDEGGILVEVHAGLDACGQAFLVGIGDQCGRGHRHQARKALGQQCEVRCARIATHRLQHYDLGAQLGVSAGAERFSLSVRTFRNRLSQQGETFQGILDAERQRQARQLLAETALSVKEIAWQLGFRESSNFSRVFKRWSGQTPLDYRLSSKVSARRRR